MRAIAVAILGIAMSGAANGQDLESRVKDGFADSNGVKIHYVTLGSGPLVVMIHGFPDYWYTWRHQMDGLAGSLSRSWPSISAATT